MRALPVIAVMVLLAACSAPKEDIPAGPTPLPAHPVGAVSKSELPPAAPATNSTGSGCSGSTRQGCN